MYLLLDEREKLFVQRRAVLHLASILIKEKHRSDVARIRPVFLSSYFPYEGDVFVLCDHDHARRDFIWRSTAQASSATRLSARP